MPLGFTAAPIMALGPRACLDAARDAESLGYDSYWVAEATGPEAFSLLGAVSRVAPGLDLATGVLALQLRTPPLAAMGAATLQAMAPEREVLLGIGISSPVVAGRWHGAPFTDRPLARVREYVALVRACLTGERVDFAGDFWTVRGFRLGVRLGERRPKIVIGALNEQMLSLAGEIADGVLLNYLPADAVPWAVEQVRKGGAATIYAYVHVGVAPRTPDAVARARHDLFSYAVVDAYAASFRRAGFAEEVDEIRARHAAGDREGALAAVSDRFIDAIDFVGDADAVAARVRAYAAAGVEVPIIFPLPWGADRAAVVTETMRVAASALRSGGA